MATNDDDDNNVSRGFRAAIRLRNATRYFVGALVILIGGSIGHAIGYAIEHHVTLRVEDLTITGVLCAILAVYFAQVQFEIACAAVLQLEESRLDSKKLLTAISELNATAAGIRLSVTEDTNAAIIVGNTEAEIGRLISDSVMGLHRSVLRFHESVLRSNLRAPVAINFSLFGLHTARSAVNAVAENKQQDAGNDQG